MEYDPLAAIKVVEGTKETRPRRKIMLSLGFFLKYIFERNGKNEIKKIQDTILEKKDGSNKKGFS
tara:strand:+ start:10 stop:204 length:195 start_codon:yes stop_codon:yes gene_type:complete